MDNTYRTAEPLDLTLLINDVGKNLKRYLPFVILTMALLAGLFWYTDKTRYQPKYRASATCVVQAADAVNKSDDVANNTAAGVIAQTFPYIIQNDVLRQIIEEDLGISDLPGTIYAERLGDTNIITITVIADTAQVAYDVLLSVLNNYGTVAREVLGETELTILENSGMPSEPYNGRNGRRQIMRGALIGLLIWLVALAIYGSLKKTIRNTDELKRVFNLLCLGSIPLARGKRSRRKHRTKDLFTLGHAPQAFTEGIRTLRTRVERDSAENDAEIYLVSSALAGEGKSTVSINLALSLAAKGHAVVLADMDLRKPSITEALLKAGLLTQEDAEKAAQIGMTEVLQGSRSIYDALIKSKAERLQFLPAGSVSKSALQLADPERLQAAFMLLRKEADYVIVDTPPSSIVADAAALVRHVDAGIFVIRQDYAPIEQIREGIGILHDTGLRLAGCVLNGTERGIMDYAYGYGYGDYEKRYDRKRK